MATKVISPVNVEFRKTLDIRPGDSVRVWTKILEDKGKVRLQAFEGIVLSRKHGRKPEPPSRSARSWTASASSAPSRFTLR